MKRYLTDMTTVLVWLSVFIDSGITASGAPLLTVQSAHVPFPSGKYLFLYQFVYVVPHLLTSSVAEHVSLRVHPILGLAITLLLSSVSVYMQYISFASGSLFLFFVARLLSGLFKHEKTLLSKVGSTFEGLGERVGWASFLGTFGGLLAAGYLADHVPDGVRIMYIIFMMELLAAGCLLLAYAQSAHVPIDRTRDAHYTTFVKNAFRSDSNRRHLGYLLLLTCAASVYQCMYAVLPTKSFGLPNLFTGGHYVVSLVAQSTVSKFVVGRLPGSPHRILQYALSVLFIGFLVVDYAQERGPFVYYPVSLLTIDIPAGVATIACTKLILQNVKKTETALMSRLVRHTILTAKLFGVPLRICLTEFLLNGSVAAALLAVPSIVFMLCVLAGCSKNMTVSSTVLTVSAVLSQLYF